MRGIIRGVLFAAQFVAAVFTPLLAIAAVRQFIRLILPDDYRKPNPAIHFFIHAYCAAVSLALAAMTLAGMSMALYLIRNPPKQPDTPPRLPTRTSRPPCSW